MSIKGFISKGIGFAPGSFEAFIRKGLGSATLPEVTPNRYVPKIVRQTIATVRKVVR